MSRTLFAISSVPVREKPDEDSDFVTELIVGEELEVTGESGAWLEVLVPGHATRLDPRGYPGWAMSENLVKSPGFTPTHKVVRKNRANLPLGAMLHLRDGKYVTPSGEATSIKEDDLLSVGKSVDRSPLELAREFDSLPYRWGGTDSATGADCSGLVYRVMQLLGVPVPRDADDQFDAAPFKSRSDWTNAGEGDLVFFGRKSITHVGVYLGDGTYISEHGDGGTLVRQMHEDPYLGYARYT